MEWCSGGEGRETGWQREIWRPCRGEDVIGRQRKLLVQG